LKALVLNADDFGHDPAINAAVAQAHSRGLLTSTSLMMNGARVNEAIEFAKAHPALGVGIHLCLVDGPALKPHNAPLSVNGNLPASPLALCRLLFAQPSQMETAIRSELRAQIESFRASGLAPSHCDTHMHAHLHPRICRIVAELAREFQIPFVRAPVDTLRSVFSGRARLASKFFRWALFGFFARRARAILRAAGCSTAKRSVGAIDPGHLNERFVTSCVTHLGPGVTEIFGHPALDPSPEARARQAGYDHAGELAALCSSRLASLIELRGVRLVNFHALARSSAVDLTGQLGSLRAHE
jgi:hopanoid biosynthesis associated protein HpnK